MSVVLRLFERCLRLYRVESCFEVVTEFVFRLFEDSFWERF